MLSGAVLGVCVSLALGRQLPTGFGVRCAAGACLNAAVAATTPLPFTVGFFVGSRAWLLPRFTKPSFFSSVWR